jgi:hypothetical protein
LKDFKAEAESLFDQATIAELAQILLVTNPAVIEEFRKDLIESCAHYREVISTLPCDLPDAPINLTLTKRADWLEANVIKPAKRLLEATDELNKPMFSTWPYPLTIPKFRDNSSLQRELSDILDHAEMLRDSLRGQQAGDAAHSQELRMEVFMTIARAFQKHAPKVPPNRGTYDAHEDRKKRKRVGRYVDAMRLVFKLITGTNENLDRLIRGEIIDPF